MRYRRMGMVVAVGVLVVSCLSPSGFITAFDGDNMAIGYSRELHEKWQASPVNCMFTRNGGQTWEGENGTGKPDTLFTVWSEKNMGHSLQNNSAGVLSAIGCCGPHYLGPRLFLHKIDFTGSAGWKRAP